MLKQCRYQKEGCCGRDEESRDSQGRSSLCLTKWVSYVLPSAEERLCVRKKTWQVDARRNTD